MVRSIGLHLRVNNNLEVVIDYAKTLRMNCFQCFFIFQPTRSPLVISDKDIVSIHDQLKSYNGMSYLHASYQINLSRPYVGTNPVLEREVELATKLGFQYIVLHPGAVKNKDDKQWGINILVDALNDATKKYPAITFVLENTAHGGKSIGSNLYDFREIRNKLIYPDRVKFCIDTAHAFAYGYDITDEYKQDNFIELIDSTIGIENVSLIHLNDTMKECGSRHDQHDIIGSGCIGERALRRFVLHQKLKHIPLILELPALPEREQSAILEQVKSWHC